MREIRTLVVARNPINLLLLAGLTLVLALVLAACAADEPAPVGGPAAPQQPAAGADPQAPADPQAGEAAMAAADPAARATPTPVPPPPLPTGGPRFGGIARIAHRTDPPRGWDPMRTGSISLLNVSGSIYGMGNLIRPCRDGTGAELCPVAAVSWESNDATDVWTFKLRPGMFWHDGKAFTPDDALWWAELAAFGATSGDAVRRPANWTWSDNVESVAIVGGDSLQFTLKRPQPFFDALLGLQGNAIAHPKHLMQPLIEAGDVNVAPIDIGFVALGPYKVEEYKRGSIIKVRKFDQYWETDDAGNRLPYMDGIDFFIIKDASAMDTAFRTGRLDATARGTGFQLTPEREAAILRSLGDDVYIGKMAQSSYWNLGINVLREGPLQDVRVRRAINLWIDREAALLNTYGGFGRVTGMFLPESPWTNDDILERPGWNQQTKAADRVRAKELLTEAGYPNGFDVGFMCRSAWVFVCEVQVGQLTELGLNVDLQIVDDATRDARTLEADFDMRLNGPTLSIPEAYDLQSHSLLPTGDYKHEDQKVNDFFTRFDAARTVEERSVIAKEMEQYVAIDQVYGVWLFTEEAHTAFRTELVNVPIPADNYRRNLTWATAWLER